MRPIWSGTDLMAALRESVEQTKKKQQRPRKRKKQPARRAASGRFGSSRVAVEWCRLDA